MTVGIVVILRVGSNEEDTVLGIVPSSPAAFAVVCLSGAVVLIVVGVLADRVPTGSGIVGAGLALGVPLVLAAMTTVPSVAAAVRILSIVLAFAFPLSAVLLMVLVLIRGDLNGAV